jgi:hypothetical protein
MSNYMSLYMYSKLKLWDAVYAYFYNRNLRFFYVDLSPVTEFIDPVFAKTSPKRSFSMIENERFGLVFSKTGSVNSGTFCNTGCLANIVILFSVSLSEKILQ